MSNRSSPIHISRTVVPAQKASESPNLAPLAYYFDRTEVIWNFLVTKLRESFLRHIKFDSPETPFDEFCDKAEVLFDKILRLDPEVCRGWEPHLGEALLLYPSILRYRFQDLIASYCHAREAHVLGKTTYSNMPRIKTARSSQSVCFPIQKDCVQYSEHNGLPSFTINGNKAHEALVSIVITKSTEVDLYDVLRTLIAENEEAFLKGEIVGSITYTRKHLNADNVFNLSSLNTVEQVYVTTVRGQ